MTTFVVDTNVAIAANGRRTHADMQCQLACVDKLKAVVASQVVAVDDRGEIVQEYAKHLSYAGMPGVGDMFFKHVFDCQYQGDRVLRVSVTPLADEGRGFEELPPNSFDPSDRKFVAVAVAGKAVVLNATDSDWGEHATLMSSLALEVHQLCPQHAARQPDVGCDR